MRTTLDIDADVLQLAKEIASSRKLTAGKVISELVRESLQRRNEDTEANVRNGVPVFAANPAGEKPTLDLVNRLRDGA